MHIFFFRRTWIALSFMCVAFYSMWALFLYRATNASFLYYTTELNNISAFHAHVASFLVFLFGGAAWIVIGCLFFFAYLLVRKKSLVYEWERFIACVGFTAASAAILYGYHVDFHYGMVPGGYSGMCMFKTIDFLLGEFLARVFFFMVLLASVLIVTRLCYMPFVHFVYRSADAFCVYMQKNRIVQRAWNQCERVVYACGMMCSRIVRGVWRLLNGELFRDADMLVPDDQFIQIPIIHMQNETQNKINTIEKKTYKKKASVCLEEVPEPKTLQKTDGYTLPGLDIFVAHDNTQHSDALTQELESKAVMLQEKLDRFGIAGVVTAIKRGPVVTLYEYKPEIDIKISKILALEDDLALALQAVSIRIIAPIPGRAVVGFEVANIQRQSVLLSQVLHSNAFKKSGMALPLALGVDTIGESSIVDLARMPHLLIAGSTGSGKSVALNTMLMSLLCYCSPDQLKLILIDPKRLEFASYADIAHLLFPIVTDSRRASSILRWVVSQMEERYELMAHHGVRTITDYNHQIAKGSLRGEHIPFIVVVIDELSDLMMTAGRDVEDGIARIAQMARAAGIHLIIATQRPSVDVITGLIKVNFPSRISFRVTSRIDSRTILDCGGAEKLLGRGDMLFLDSHSASLRRLHGAYVSDEEIAKTVQHIRQERPVEYLDISQALSSIKEKDTDVDDELYNRILIYLKDIDEVSISLLQRTFRIGYNRSARIIEQLEKHGRIMPPEGGKPRKVVH